jgi:hypothetical protein
MPGGEQSLPQQRLPHTPAAREQAGRTEDVWEQEQVSLLLL